MQLQGSKWSLEGTGELALVHQQTLQNLSHVSLILQMVSFSLSILTLYFTGTFSVHLKIPSFSSRNLEKLALRK